MTWEVGAIKKMRKGQILKTHRLFFTLMFLLILTTPGFSRSEELPRTTIVVTMGTGQIVSGADATNAREKAISDALISALETILAGMLPTESLSTNFKALNAILYQHKDGLIQEYKILAEDKSGKYYRVMLEATVLVTRFMQLLIESGIGGTQASMPGILFLVAEENLEDVAIQYWWGKGMKETVTASEKAISESLQKKGFSVIDHVAMDAARPPGEEGPFYNATLDLPAVMEMAARYKADVVITGSAQVVRAANTMGGGLKSFTGKLSIKAYRAGTGTEIASAEKTAVLADKDDITGSKAVLSKVALMTAQDIGPMILSGWIKPDRKETDVTVNVYGTNELSHFVAFREVLSKTQGVKGIQLKEMESGRTTLLVRYQGDANELANTLLLNTFETFGLNINLLAESTIKVEMVPAPQ